MRSLGTWAVVVGGIVMLSAGSASAQISAKPIDTNKAIVQPADAAANIFTGTSRIISRVVANTIDDNGFVRTFNSLLGRKPEPKTTTQPGGLPLPSLYPSTRYPNSFVPVMPKYSTFGRTPGT